ncbi:MULTISPECIES: malto-oligosyltrehalose trehalohydrolase [Bosea]|uniref:malto-oligosyltrehalose trehalohydrolase n=1 Tax=Bosea TaxID=85413 RepID=UPI00286B9DF3|nr:MULTISPECIES: malto-oligosyltrehalose trehalohydrolase [Bosea]
MTENVREDGKRFRFGAWRTGSASTFRLWAPALSEVQIEIGGAGRSVAMVAIGGGWFEHRADLPFGTRYRYRSPEGLVFPDPASRRQEGGVHGWSVLTDPDSYSWRCASWRGRPWRETVLYEIHPGLVGGFAGIERELPRLAELGITAVELMPIADFPGERSWGYDGVLPFAPAAAYGTPDDLKRLVDRAHELGLAVHLDVVFNHFGPDGCYLHAYAPQFFRVGSHTPWGAAIDFDRPDVRAYFIACAVQWLGEYRFDGLRLDAIHAIPSTEFLLDFEREVRSALPADRHIQLVVENDANDSRLLSRFDAQWNDDFHHAVHVMLTGEATTYYGSFADDPIRHLARVMAEGFAFQGEVASFSGEPRGRPSSDLAPTRFVNCLQNHDQIGNRLFGDRLLALADPAAVRVAVALLLLNPQIPLLFMGEEFGSRTPFLYFTDHHEELAQAVREGRAREFAHVDPCGETRLFDPNAAETFNASKPDAGEDGAEWSAFYRRLIALRRDRVVPHLDTCRSIGAVALGSSAVRACWHLSGGTLTLLANFGDEAVGDRPPEGAEIFALGEAERRPDGLLLGARSFRALLS